MMSTPNLVIVDYGMGNLWSVASALNYLGAEAIVTHDPDLIVNARGLILPGVGSFRNAMIALKALKIDGAIKEAVHGRGRKILGICLGMQLLGSRGTEDGETEGLGVVPNQVDRFAPSEVGINKVPHIGFNTVRIKSRDGLFKGLAECSDFYFVHSYRMLLENFEGRTAICEYGQEFLAAFQHDNVCGTQFHPEKSQVNGLTLLKNFLEL
jgi:glutamine amidotransferase